jgi:hypothetical protein
MVKPTKSIIAIKEIISKGPNLISAECFNASVIVKTKIQKVPSNNIVNTFLN